MSRAPVYLATIRRPDGRVVDRRSFDCDPGETPLARLVAIDHRARSWRAGMRDITIDIEPLP